MTLLEIKWIVQPAQMNETTGPVDSSLIDVEQIQMLIEAGAAESLELVTELLDLYEGERKQKLDDIRDKASTGDFEALGRAAHALAGSSANVGGKRVWDMAKQMENDCKEGRGASAVQSIDTLEKVHAGTMIALRSYLDTCMQ